MSAAFYQPIPIGDPPVLTCPEADGATEGIWSKREHLTVTDGTGRTVTATDNFTYAGDPDEWGDFAMATADISIGLSGCPKTITVTYTRSCEQSYFYYDDETAYWKDFDETYTEVIEYPGVCPQVYSFSVSAEGQRFAGGVMWPLHTSNASCSITITIS